MRSNRFASRHQIRALLSLALLLLAATALSPDAARCAGRAPSPASLEVKAFRLLNGAVANPVFDRIMPFATDFGKWRIAVVIIWSALVVFGKTRGRWAALLLIPIIVASDQLASSVIKPLIERSRPCEVLGGVHLWHGREGWITTPIEAARSYKASFSFPSSHAANITASMLFLGLVYRRWLAPLLAVAFLVSFSRIYVGVHWPSDVAVGMALGAGIAWLAYALFKRFSGEGVPGSGITRSEPDKLPSE